MSGSNKLLLSMMLLFALFHLAKADSGHLTSDFENVHVVSEDITLLENGTANIDFRLDIPNDTITRPGNYIFSLNENRNQNFTYFNCDVIMWNLSKVRGTPYWVRSEKWNYSRATDGIGIGIRKIIEFNRTSGFEESIRCQYGIANYAKEIRPAEWLIEDYFWNKHGANHFDLSISIPDNTAFNEISPVPNEKSICDPNRNCHERIWLEFGKNHEYKPPKIYITYEKISLDAWDVWNRNSKEILIGSFLGGIIGVILETLLSKRITGFGYRCSKKMKLWIIKMRRFYALHWKFRRLGR